MFAIHRHPQSPKPREQGLLLACEDVCEESRLLNRDTNVFAGKSVVPSCFLKTFTKLHPSKLKTLRP